MVAQNIFFGIIALLMVVGAIRVVTTRNVVHAALWLVLVLSGAAGQYILLTAEFVGITQVLVYVGAIMVLFLFGTMLTRARLGRESELNNPWWGLGLLVGLLLLGAMSVALISSFGDDELPETATPVSVRDIADDILGPYLIPFFGLSFLLVAAVIGAIVLARRD
jgi:NADH-quinone oxidoreductase subunit J